MVFDFLKKKEETPPDVGQEEAYDAAKEKAEGKEDEAPEMGKLDVKTSPTASKIKNAPTAGGGVEMEKMKARIDSVVEWINQFYERFSYVSESIGELRSMNLANEKKIMDATKEADKVIGIVKEVKPEQLRIDYQRVDMRIKKFEEMVAENKNFVESVVKEFNELKKKSEAFVGTEALMKLNEDTKKELVETQKLAAQTRLNADKGKEIFLELRKGFADSQKVAEVVNALDANYTALKEEVDNFKLNMESVVKRDEYGDFKKTYGNKLAAYDSIVSQMEGLKEDNKEFHDLLETSLNISKRNEEDIANIALKVGSDKAKRVEDYENQLADVVDIVETLTEQVSELKKKVGIEDDKIDEIVEREKGLEKEIAKKGGRKRGVRKKRGRKKKAEEEVEEEVEEEEVKKSDKSTEKKVKEKSSEEDSSDDSANDKEKAEPSSDDSKSVEEETEEIDDKPAKKELEIEDVADKGGMKKKNPDEVINDITKKAEGEKAEEGGGEAIGGSEKKGFFGRLFGG